MYIPDNYRIFYFVFLLRFFIVFHAGHTKIQTKKYYMKCIAFNFECNISDNI
jgi:hypothetical protein